MPLIQLIKHDRQLLHMQLVLQEKPAIHLPTRRLKTQPIRHPIRIRTRHHRPVIHIQSRIGLHVKIDILQLIHRIILPRHADTGGAYNQLLFRQPIIRNISPGNHRPDDHNGNPHPEHPGNIILHRRNKNQ